MRQPGFIDVILPLHSLMVLSDTTFLCVLFVCVCSGLFLLFSCFALCTLCFVSFFVSCMLFLCFPLMLKKKKKKKKKSIIITECYQSSRCKRRSRIPAAFWRSASRIHGTSSL